LTGTSSKSILRSSVERCSVTRSFHAFGSRAGVMSRATSSIASSANPASDTMPRSGGNTRPIWYGSMSTCTNLRSPR
jgi:hypothetical protein